MGNETVCDPPIAQGGSDLRRFSLVTAPPLEVLMTRKKQESGFTYVPLIIIPKKTSHFVSNLNYKSNAFIPAIQSRFTWCGEYVLIVAEMSSYRINLLSLI